MKKKEFRAKIDYLEQELLNYDRTKERMNDLRTEIQNPWRQQDENIGGGRSNANVSVTETSAIRLINDKRIEHLERVTKAIDSLYEESTEVEKMLLELYYFEKPRQLTDEGVAIKLHISRASFYRIRKHILLRLAEELGIEM